MKQEEINNCKIVYYKEIGEVKLVKSRRSRKLSIKVRPFDGVIVNIPIRLSFKLAENFVEEQSDWIKCNLRKMEKYEDKLTVFEENTTFCTKKHRLYIEKWDKDYISVRVLNWKIMVKYPSIVHVRDERIQKTIRRGIERALMIEAEEYLPSRIAYLSEKFGFDYKSVTVKNGKTRWGSCSFDNKINLNLHLMRLPSQLIDYVIIHELCHTVQKNHSSNFWNLMCKIDPNSKVLDNELKKYQTKVY